MKGRKKSSDQEEWRRLTDLENQFKPSSARVGNNCFDSSGEAIRSLLSLFSVQADKESVFRSRFSPPEKLQV